MYSLTVLGAYGAKSKQGGSSAFLVNSKTMIDAGNLLDPLEEKSADIETIWLTHSHLDHIIDIAYILDNYFYKREDTLVIRGSKKTLSSIKNHFFNNEIWPDFSKIPLLNKRGMTLSYEPLNLGKSYIIDDDISIRAFKTDHTVDSCGYIVSRGKRAVLISADIHDLNSVIREVKTDSCIKTMVIECSFPSDMLTLAKESKHLTPALLFEGLEPLNGRNIKLYINHIKPLYENEIRDEITNMKGTWNIEILKDGANIFF